MHIHIIIVINPLLLLLIHYYYYYYYYYYYSIIIVHNLLSLQSMLEMFREVISLYKVGIGKTANHMGYVKNAIVVFSFRTLNLI
jgi:hypothetical protein